ncbi:MAG: TIGR03118 family protein [Steroidobacteraceae bacterium]
MTLSSVGAAWSAAVLGIIAFGASAGEHDAVSRLPFYSVHNLVSDGAVPADHIDPNLKNPWGLVFGPTSPSWIANNGTGTSTLYDGAGAIIPLVVKIPPGSREPGNPTGIVFNATDDFKVSEGALSGASVFIFAGENGTLNGWAPNVNSTSAVVAYDGGPAGAVYKGLALASNGTANFIYATNFHGNSVDVFDKNFKKIAVRGGFKDDDIPPGFAPFGIQNIQGDLFVTYAKQNAALHDNLEGSGLGFVDVFDADGRLLRRVASRGPLNAPWAIALAPSDFGRFSNRLLVGNFGDGTINAFDYASGEHVGRLSDSDGHPIAIDGLWGLSFGNGVLSQSTASLFFAAGTNHEQDGTYGRIDPARGDDHDGHGDE